MDIRLLKAGEIECRVQSVKKTDNGAGCILLIYKDARVDQRVLDEVFGPMGWQRDHKELKGNIYCGIGIHNGQEWVWKWDCGSESNTEKEKGEASDSFKRAGFNWGIGRELYTAPFIWIDLDNGEYSEKDGKYYLKPKVKFEVTFISCNSDKEINRLQIKDNHHKVRYDLTSPVRSQNPPQGNKPVGNNNNPPGVNQDSTTAHKCCDCGNDITATKKKTVEQILADGVKYYKFELCQSCINIRYKAAHPDA
jgi:hypothetical protein